MRQRGESVPAKLEQAVVRRYCSGIGGNEIAVETGISKCVVYRILKRNAVPTRRDFSRVGKDHRLFDDETEGKIAQEYIAGGTLNGLARKYKSNLVTIRNVLVRQGVERRRRGNSFKRLGGCEKKKLASLRKAGKSYKDVAKQIGISRQLVELVDRGKKPKEMCSDDHRKENRVRWQGGYVSVPVPRESPYYCMVNGSGYVFEHRLVMARHLGRPLREDESVHHINGDKTDNKIENLQLIHVGHPRGVAFCCRKCGSIDIEPIPLKPKGRVN